MGIENDDPFEGRSYVMQDMASDRFVSRFLKYCLLRC